MGVDFFTGRGVGFGFGIGCGFGLGWGFGGAPLNLLGIGAGGGCGVGLGLGWGFGAAYGTKYLDSKLKFEGIDFDKTKGERVEQKRYLICALGASKGSLRFANWKRLHVEPVEQMLSHSCKIKTCINGIAATFTEIRPSRSGFESRFRSSAGIAQLGERQTEDLKVACSIHAHRNPFCCILLHYFGGIPVHKSFGMWLGGGDVARISDCQFMF